MGPLLEEVIELLFGRALGYTFCASAGPFNKRHIFAKIGAILVDNPLGLGFPALVVCGPVMEGAVSAAMKLSAARETGFSESRFSLPEGEGGAALKTVVAHMYAV